MRTEAGLRRAWDENCLEALALAHTPEPVSLAERLVARLGRCLADANPLQVLEIALDRALAGDVALVSSFGTESAVLLHMAATIDRAVPVLFLDTGYMFEETLAYRDLIAERFGLTDLRILKPDPVDLKSEDGEGDLWMRNPDACCHLRKVVPLERALAGFDGWINGRKRFHGDTRTNIPAIEVDGPRAKFTPLASMTATEIEAYFVRYDLPRHPMQAKGYASIGCLPCSSRTLPGESVRAGRWRGRGKTECGIHGNGS